MITNHKIHEIKIDSDYFHYVLTGKKKFELRKNDRDFKKGDVVYLMETEYSSLEMENGKPLKYTGRNLIGKIDYILYGDDLVLQSDWCIFSLNFDKGIPKCVNSNEKQLPKISTETPMPDVKKPKESIKNSEGVVFQNKDGKFLHVYSVTGHIANKTDYDWVDINRSTVFKNNVNLRSWIWADKSPINEIVVKIPAEEQRSVSLKGE